MAAFGVLGMSSRVHRDFMSVTPQQILAQMPLAERLLARLHEDTDGMSDRDEVVRVIAAFLAEHDDGSVRASANRMFAALDQVVTDMQAIANMTDSEWVDGIANKVASYAAAARRPV